MSTVVLFQDETVLRELPPLRACWARQGQQAVVPITGSNARRVVFGALNPRTGKRLFLVRVRNRAEDFQAFLHYLRSTYRKWDLLLVLDSGSSHLARKSRELAGHLRIKLAWLPTACPELNPVEALWRDGKQKVSANRVYPSVAEQASAFISHLNHLSPRAARQTAGTLSPNFWLPT